jgi:phage gpG-like protein
MSGATGTRVVYGAIQEEGGDIVPRRAKMLAVPLDAALTPAGVGRYRSPLRETLRSAFPGGTFVHKGVLFGKKTKTSQPVALFALKPRVTIPARPFLGPAGQEQHERVNAVFALAVADIVRGDR